MMKFPNGNKIEKYKSSADNIRGNRSRIIGFVCKECKGYKEQNVKDIFWIGEDTLICKQCIDEIFRPLIKEKR